LQREAPQLSLWVLCLNTLGDRYKSQKRDAALRAASLFWLLDISFKIIDRLLRWINNCGYLYKNPKEEGGAERRLPLLGFMH
jgi:hypothetical protein